MFIIKLVFHGQEDFSRGESAGDVWGCFCCWLFDFMVVLGMCEGWEEVQKKNLRSLFNSSAWTISMWKMKICPSAPTTKM